MLYLTGIIGLHSGKYELIYLTKRSLPIKTNSINIWLVIIEFVAVLGIVVNFAFVIYVRNLFENEKSTVFFMLILFSLIIKYLLSVTTDEKGSQMFKRNEQKTLNLLHERGGLSKLYDPEPIFTDLENVVYD